MGEIKISKFKNVDLNDHFFDSLKEDYSGFESWFKGKAEEDIYILDKNNSVQAFLYMKVETEDDFDIIPPLVLKGEKILKVGTFKINAHGSKLGERFIKLIFDKMIEENITKSYVTIYEKQGTLISLLTKYGFNYYGTKKGEKVYLKDFNKITGEIKKDYPIVRLKETKKFLLSIYPEYHTELFPDSRLKTEKNHIVKDLSHTNCIEKVYLSRAKDIMNYKKGDIVAIYRTAEAGKKAEYNAVVTSICTIYKTESVSNFLDKESFFKYCSKRTIFEEDELNEVWKNKKYFYIVKLLYNAALNKRIIRKELLDEIGVSREARLVVYPLSDIQIQQILNRGEVSNLIIK